MADENLIHFLLDEALEGYEFSEQLEEGLRFNDVEAGLEIIITSLNGGLGGLKIQSKTSCHASAQQVAFIDSLVCSRYRNDLGTIKNLPLLMGDIELISADGMISKGYFIRWDMVPDDLRCLCDQIVGELRDRTVRFVRLLRWRQSLSGPNEVFQNHRSTPSFYWKTNQDEYHRAPMVKHDKIKLAVDGGMKWSDNDQQNLKALWVDLGVEEPLGHQLIREARQNRSGNPRSALLLAYLALEVGIKEHISKCVHEADWLVMNSPTPPLSRILKEYLPQLHSQDMAIKNWTKLSKKFKLVEDFAKDRNRLAHRGDMLDDKTNEYIELASDFLYAVDALAGQGWAKELVGHEFGSLLGWPTRPRGEVKIWAE